jgi:hypothetical protein
MLFQVYSVESIIVEEGKHHIRTGDSPLETEDTTDRVGSRIQQVQQLQQIADTVRIELNGVKKFWPHQIVRTISSPGGGA